MGGGRDRDVATGTPGWPPEPNCVRRHLIGREFTRAVSYSTADEKEDPCLTLNILWPIAKRH